MTEHLDPNYHRDAVCHGDTYPDGHLNILFDTDRYADTDDHALAHSARFTVSTLPP